jgi:8-oxo-dGTP pyrophosphatase MutT (NUDIX family)
MVKIYFDNKPVLLVSDKSQANEYLHHPETIFIDDFDPPAINTMIYEMQQDSYDTGVFVHEDIQAVLDAFQTKFTVIRAAGGFVYTSNKEVLLIFRRGKWDLPKGKLDENESLAECALREVKEETGVADLSLKQPLITTYHTYHQDNQHILKETHWFLMNSKDQALKPQVEEDIEKCEWVPFPELDTRLSGTYALIRDVVEEAKKHLSPSSNK